MSTGRNPPTKSPQSSSRSQLLKDATTTSNQSFNDFFRSSLARPQINVIPPSIRRYKGIQRLPSTLKAKDERTKRHAHFFKEMMAKEKKEKPVSGLFGRVK